MSNRIPSTPGFVGSSPPPGTPAVEEARGVSAGDGASAEPEAPTGSFGDVLQQAVRQLDRDERALQRATRALRTGSVREQEKLIALQLVVYRYGQRLTLASRLVDSATRAVRQVLHSQAP